MKESKPLIAVTGPVKRLKFGWWATRFALRLNGVQCIYVTPESDRWPDDVAGFVIGGGDDIDPKHYGQSGSAGARYDAARDAMEMRAIGYAIERKLPILGICRGSQLLNIVLGGSLITDLRPLRKRTPNRNSIFAMKYANLVENSQLQSIFGVHRVRINSLHHQAVNDVGEGMQAAAHDDDGFLQATEHVNHRFVIGVQWHPEYLPFKKQQRKLFASFVAAVRELSA